MIDLPPPPLAVIIAVLLECELLPRLEIFQFQREEIFRIFEVPPHFFDEAGQPSADGIEDGLSGSMSTAVETGPSPIHDVVSVIAASDAAERWLERGKD
jgi:hypothetical protein